MGYGPPSPPQGSTGAIGVPLRSLLAAIEESYAGKRWTGSACDLGYDCDAGGSNGSCGLQFASAAAVARNETELDSLVSAGATCAYTRYNDLPWFEVASFTDMLRSLALKHNLNI